LPRVGAGTMEAILTKTLNGFVPATPETQEWANKVKTGGIVKGKFTQTRNAAFHRKYFALLNIAFDHWEPGELDTKYGKPEKNFDRFRKDIAILSGFYELVFRVDGSYRVQAKSISFASMSQEEFEQLYSKTIDVLLKQVYNYKLSGEEMDELVEQYLLFA